MIPFMHFNFISYCVNLYDIFLQTVRGDNMKKEISKHVLSLLLFGSNGIFAGMLDRSSYDIVFVRTLLGTFLLLTIFLCTKGKFQFFHHKHSFLYLMLSGLSMGLSWMFLYEAFQQIGVCIATLGYYCGPMIVMLLSPFIFHEKLSRTKIGCFFLVLIGMFFLNAHAVTESHTGFGILCAIFSAIFYAIMVIFNKKSAKITGIESTIFQLFFACIIVACVVFLKKGFALPIKANEILPMCILGLSNTGFACYLYFTSLSKINVQTTAILGYLEPLSAIFFSVIFLNERLLPLQIVGAFFILGGAFFSELRNSKKEKS